MLKANNYIFLFIILIFCSCDKLDTRDLVVKNSSDKVIFSILSDNDNMNSGGFYYEFRDDFDESKRGKYDMPFIFNEIKKGQKDYNGDRPRYWDTYFDSLEDKKARLFIVEKDSVEKYGWKEIFNKNIYNKKYLITLEQLDSLNWQLNTEESRKRILNSIGTTH